MDFEYEAPDLSALGWQMEAKLQGHLDVANHAEQQGLSDMAQRLRSEVAAHLPRVDSRPLAVRLAKAEERLVKRVRAVARTSESEAKAQAYLDTAKEEYQRAQAEEEEAQRDVASLRVLLLADAARSEGQPARPTAPAPLLPPASGPVQPVGLSPQAASELLARVTAICDGADTLKSGDMTQIMGLLTAACAGAAPSGPKGVGGTGDTVNSQSSTVPGTGAPGPYGAAAVAPSRASAQPYAGRTASGPDGSVP